MQAAGNVNVSYEVWPCFTKKPKILLLILPRIVYIRNYFSTFTLAPHAYLPVSTVIFLIPGRPVFASKRTNLRLDFLQVFICQLHVSLLASLCLPAALSNQHLGSHKIQT